MNQLFTGNEPKSNVHPVWYFMKEGFTGQCNGPGVSLSPVRRWCQTTCTSYQNLIMANQLFISLSQLLITNETYHIYSYFFKSIIADVTGNALLALFRSTLTTSSLWWSSKLRARSQSVWASTNNQKSSKYQTQVSSALWSRESQRNTKVSSQPCVRR